MAKRSKQKKAQQIHINKGFGTKSLAPELAKAEALIRRAQWQEAHTILQDLTSTYPDNIEVLRNLIEVYYALEYSGAYQVTCEKLLALKPNDSEIAFQLGEAYLVNYSPLLALQCLQSALGRWPDHEQATAAREQVAMIESNLSEFLASMGFEHDQVELATDYERAKAELTLGEVEVAIATLQTILTAMADCLPAQQLLSQAYYRQGKFDPAKAIIQQILVNQPDNTQALANLIQYLCLQGNLTEAKQYQPQILASPATDLDNLQYKAQALSYLDDDAAIIALLKIVPPDPETDNRPLATATFHHLAAVALARQGEVNAAQEQWQIALEIESDLEIARENLEDLTTEAAYQNGPWPFQMIQWLPSNALQEVRNVALVMAPNNEITPQLTQAVTEVLEKYPYLEQLVPIWLQRGGPRAKLLGVAIAQGAQTTGTKAALEAFVLGQAGPDQLRYQIGSQLARTGQLPANYQLWLDGEWHTDIPLITYEIIETVSQSAPVQNLIDKALKKIALESPKAAQTAELLLQEALTIEPNNPVLLNHLSVAYNLQEKYDEALTLTDQILEQHPHDVASRIAKAQIALDEANPEAAFTMIIPLLKLKQFNGDDFVSLVLTYSKILLAQDKPNLARRWFQEAILRVPDHPLLKRLGMA